MDALTELTLTDSAKRQVVRKNLTFTVILVPLFAMNAFTVWVTTRNTMLALAFVLLALVAVPLVYVVARRTADRSRVVFGDSYVAGHGWGRREIRTVAAMESVVTVCQMGFMGAMPTHHLIVLGPQKRLLLLVGQMWDREQLSALALDLVSRGVSLVAIAQSTTPRQLRALDHRLIPWRQAHPIGVLLLTVLGVLLVLVAAFAIMVAILL